MKEELLTFDEILRQESYVICDSSLTSISSPDWYQGCVYDARFFSEIDRDILGAEIIDSKSFLEVLRNPIVFTTKGILYELKNARDMIGDKLKFLKKQENLIGRKARKRFHKGDNQKILLQQILDTFYESSRQSGMSVFFPEQEFQYNALERIVFEVAKHTDSKINLDEFYPKTRAKLKKVQDFHTDEEMVASALYLSAVDSRGGCILTRDSDIRRILMNTLAYMSLSDVKGLYDILNTLKKHRIRIYYVIESERGYLVFDTSKFDSSRSKLSREIIDSIDEETRLLENNPFTQLWHKLRHR